MSKAQKQIVRDLDSFEDISLWQLIPAGKGYALTKLKTIVDSIHNSNNTKIPSILLTGLEGKRTYGRSFIRALGIETINEIHGSLLQPVSGVMQFFCNTTDTAHLITDVNQIHSLVKLSICQILKYKRFYLFNYMKEGLESFEVPGLIVLTAKDINKVAGPIVDAVDYIIEIEPYNIQQSELVVLQRLKYCNIDYEMEEVLSEIVSFSDGELKKIIKFLKVCIAVMRSAGREDKLLLKDVEEAGRIG